MSAFIAMLRMGVRRRALRSMALASVVVALAAAGLSAAVLVRQDAAHAVDAAFAAGHGPDLIVTTSAAAADRVRQALAADAGVVEVGAARPIARADTDIGDERIALIVNGLDPTPSLLNQPVLTAGRLPETSGEIAVETAVADETRLALGDLVTVRTPTTTGTFTVVGLGFDFTDCFYPTCDPARAWVVGRALTALDPQPRALLAVDLSDPALADAVGRQLAAATADDVDGYSTWLDTRGDLLAESDFFGAFLGAFGVLALVASLVVVGGMITARTWSRRRALAQLRSLGCTRGQVTAVLLVEHAMIGVVGCVLGNVGAALAAPSLRIGALAVLGGSGAGLPLAAVAGSTVVVMTLVAIATLAPAARAGRRDVVGGLVAIPETSGRPSVFGRLLDRVPMPVPVAVGVRSAVTRPLRAALSAAAIGLAVITTMVAVSIGSTMDEMLAHPALTGDPGDATVEPPPEMSVAQATAMLDTMPEVAGWFSVADGTAVIGERSVHVRAIGGDPRASGFAIGGGRPLVRRGEAVAGYGLLTAAGWRLGQQVRLDVGDRSIDVRLVGWYRETEDDGELLQIRMEDLDRLSGGTTPRFVAHGRPGTTPSQIGAAVASRFGERARVRVHAADGDRLAPFRVAVATMAALIGVVALAHMSAVAVLTSRERSRRTGALRALGMTRQSMFGEAVAATTVPVIVAIAAGVPLGWLATRRIGDLITGQLGAGPGLTQAPQAGGLAAIVAAVAVTAIAVALLAARPVIGRPIPELLHDPG